MTGLAYLVAFAVLAIAGFSWARVLMTWDLRPATRKPARYSPRHKRARATGDLFGRPGATNRTGAFTGALITNLESDWPTPEEIEAAEWECCWRRFDDLLARTAREGTYAIAATGVPLEVLAAVSLAEVERHERATVHASELVPA